MDRQFLNQRLACLASYRCGLISLKKERTYYSYYMKKIQLNLMYLNYTGKDDIQRALKEVERIKTSENKRIKNGIFYKPIYVLEMVCEDAKDAISSMQRWVGVEEVFGDYNLGIILKMELEKL